MMIIDIIWYIAAILTTIAFLPQVYKIWKTKSTKDISLVMFILFSIWILLWLIYWLLLSSYPIIIANIITFILSVIILYFKLKYK